MIYKIIIFFIEIFRMLYSFAIDKFKLYTIVSMKLAKKYNPPIIARFSIIYYMMLSPSSRITSSNYPIEYLKYTAGTFVALKSY